MVSSVKAILKCTEEAVAEVAAIVSFVTVCMGATPEVLPVIWTSTYRLWRNVNHVGSFLIDAASVCTWIWHTLSIGR